jgi:uncharacterized protein YacL
VGAVGGLGFGGMLVLVDMLLKNFTIRSFSSGTIGLLIGVLCAWLITQIPGIPVMEGQEEIKRVMLTMLYASLGYIGIVLALRSNRQEFSLIIPYVRFRNEGVMRQPLLIDTNIIMAVCQRFARRVSWMERWSFRDLCWMNCTCWRIRPII